MTEPSSATRTGPSPGQAADRIGARALDSALEQLEVQAAAFAARFIPDAATRAEYRRAVVSAVDDIRHEVDRGQISLEQGATRAATLRNQIMEWARARTSDVGLAMARELKAEGVSFEELVARYALRKFGKTAAELTLDERNAVMRTILLKAARTNPEVDALLRGLGAAGRGLAALSLGIMVYEVFSAKNKVRAAGHQAALLGAGLAGSFIAGAEATAPAGLVCGPAAPFCVGVSALAGGVLFSLAADFAWRRATGNDDD
ncbi:MAG: hypothetical protein KGJ41_18560 [Rhodospirillales bacterium]|nr:hypothetical protein [Rhodospirillales bacterium]